MDGNGNLNFVQKLRVLCASIQFEGLQSLYWVAGRRSNLALQELVKAIEVRYGNRWHDTVRENCFILVDPGEGLEVVECLPKLGVTYTVLPTPVYQEFVVLNRKLALDMNPEKGKLYNDQDTAELYVSMYQLLRRSAE